MPFKNVFRGKRVLVTGHTGFKGSWLSLWLATLGAEVYGMALEPRTPSDNYAVIGLKNHIHHHICDITDRGKVKGLFTRIHPQIVFHLAAQAVVGRSFENPVDTFETNVMGTVHVLDAIRLTSSVETAVMITSDKCYKNEERDFGYCETDELGGLDPYGSSKACAELVIQSYRESFFNFPAGKVPGVASTRAGNVIGGGDWSENRIVPDIVRALMEHKSVELRHPEATRPWQFVLEPLSGYLWLGAQMNTQGGLTSAWNFGPEPSLNVPVKALCGKIIENWGSGSIEDMSHQNHFPEATLLNLDISKARQHLDWRPALTLDETVQFTVRWYKRFAESGAEPMYELGKQQIKEFTRIAMERKIEWAK